MKKESIEFDVPIDLDMAHPLPSEKIDGKANPEYYRVLIKRQYFMHEGYSRQGLPYTGLEASLRGIEKMCDLAGVDFKKLADVRSEAQILEDVMREIAASPDDLYARTDQELEILRKSMEEIVEQCSDVVEKQSDAAARDRRWRLTPEQIAVVRREGKAWLTRLERLQRVRMMARTPIYEKSTKEYRAKTYHTAGMEASHFLRLMMYVGRSGVKGKGVDGTDIFAIAPRRQKRGDIIEGHHAGIAVAYWKAANQVYIHGHGYQKNVIPYEGVMIIVHQGLGKTECGIHFLAARYALAPQEMMLLLHAIAEDAEKMLTYLADLFAGESPSAKRYRSLYPNLPPLRKKHKQSEFDLDVGRTRKSVSCRAAGVGDRGSGRDATTIYFDDVVDQKEADQETERRKKWERIHGTWMKRLRGKNTLWIWNATMWHDDDATSRMLALAKKRGEEAHFIEVYIDSCGGPEEDFEPVWPDSEFNKAFLKNQYFTNPSLYMTCYACKPAGANTALVRKLAYYPTHMPDGSACEEHEKFLAGAVRYVSVDPAATGKKSSDHSGIVYAGSGHIESRDGDTVALSPRLRILNVMRPQAMPNEVMDLIANFSVQNRVDYVLVEAAGQMTMFASQFRERHPNDVIEVKPLIPGLGMVSKAARLKNCQMMLDNSRRESGMIPVVEFPGQWSTPDVRCHEHPEGGLIVDGGKAFCAQCRRMVNVLVCRTDIQPMADEILRFGVCQTDDLLDGGTQLFMYLKGDLGIGQGIVSQAVKAADGKNPRMVAELESLRRHVTKEGREDEEIRAELDSILGD